MPTTTTTLLPAVDALALACSAFANVEQLGRVLMASGDQTVTVSWTALPERTIPSLALDRDLTVPAQWCTSGHVKVFAMGWVD
jgi:hypothetical protein